MPHGFERTARNRQSVATIHPVILSGGSGTRLWPMSREAFPKQLLPLVSERTLLQDTAARMSDHERFGPPMVVCNAEHRFIIAEQLRALGIEPWRIVLEPAARNTAPAVAVAALMVAENDPNGQILVLPSDHSIADSVAFQDAVSRAAVACRSGALTTFGVKPSGPHTGYGYIKLGAPLDGCNDAFKVDKFVEKPALADAEAYVADGEYFWNSGMFLFPVCIFLEELERLQPELMAGCRAAVADAATDLDFTRLAVEPFEALTGQSVDYAVMERTGCAAVVPVDIGWSDVGSWESLWEIGAQDSAGNVVNGDVRLIDVSRSYIRSDGPLVAALGVDDLAIVATQDVVLVLPRDRAQDVRALVDRLKSEDRPEAALHPRVYRPWGWYQTVDVADRFRVKRITVNPGAQLSLQKHRHRAEHWVVVYGSAEVTRGSQTFSLNENESAYIPPNTVHRLANPGRIPLNLIEVQSGSYLGEDDIERFDDQYGRG